MTVWFQVPLTDPQCRSRNFVGADLVALSRQSEAFAVPQTLVISAEMAGWTVSALSGSTGAYADLSLAIAGAVSMRAWLLRPGADDLPVEPSLHNLDPAAVPDGLLELVSYAARLRSWRHHDRLVIALQKTVPADQTVRIRVVRDDPLIRLAACLGLAEELDDPVHFDAFEVRRDVWRLDRVVVVDKPTSTTCTPAGMLTVAVQDERRYTEVLSEETVLRLAADAEAAARRAGADLDLELVLFDGQAFLLSCREAGPPGRW
ncbi:hypothetical protein GCM10010399_83480 [Dactylosporangium fulvum]|uniref:Uncharacterized protein n=1 Tax=Dactylosporangium fulvum TaxID=53359 RepID=A0ABY5WBP5_9ACTN|nr:hypothetical protein [Dactylosporangium fulvum]UWP86098.1 hypothetical protein Dfulv_18375 [Dactylosporangium fulvum]